MSSVNVAASLNKGYMDRNSIRLLPHKTNADETLRGEV